MYKKDEDVSKRIILQTLEQGKVDTYRRVCRHPVAQLGAGQPEAEGLQKRHRAVAAAAVVPAAGCGCCRGSCLARGCQAFSADKDGNLPSPQRLTSASKSLCVHE